MAKENKENLSDKENSAKEGGDINGQERIKQEKDIREEIGIREETTSSLDELKAKIEPQKDYLDMLFASESKNKNTQFQSSKKKGANFSALSSNYFDTRAWSKEKPPLYAISDSLVVFGRVGKDLVVDLAKLIISPQEQTKGTYASLQDLDPNIEKV